MVQTSRGRALSACRGPAPFPPFAPVEPVLPEVTEATEVVGFIVSPVSRVSAFFHVFRNSEELTDRPSCRPCVCLWRGAVEARLVFPTTESCG
jgi:hypothetical protein